MPQISSQLTFFTKRVFPVIGLGLLFFAAVAARSMGSPTLVTAGVAVSALALAAQGRWDASLADEVLDGGDALQIRRGRLVERIQISNISGIAVFSLTSPERITLYLREPNGFGDKVSFLAPSSLLPFLTSPIVDDLETRIYGGRKV